MQKLQHYSRWQMTALVLLRFVIGWHILYEGIAKLFNPDWSSYAFLSESQWILAGFSHWVISNTAVLQVVDWLNIWGLIGIGMALLLGIFTRYAALAGCFLLTVYFVSNPPLTGMEYTLPVEGSNLIVNKTLIEAVALFTLVVFPAHKMYGLDYLIYTQRNKKINDDKKGVNDGK